MVPMTKSNDTFGEYSEQSPEHCEYLTLAFSPLSAPLRSRWRNNGLSADFLGDYVTTFLPTHEPHASAESDQEEIRHAVTYIANELLENAMKYHDRRADVPIGIHLQLTDDSISVSASNGVEAGQARHYQEFVANLVQGEAGELLLKQLEQNSRSAGDSTVSCLGLLTMINDYGAKLGWRFAQGNSPDSLTVTTRAILPLRKFTGECA
jgi:hypothetical protein